MNAPRASEARKNFFFKKKKQKTFILFGLRAFAQSETKGNQKFFASPGGAPFFQKRSSSFLCVP
jgi:hypothetical protein